MSERCSINNFDNCRNGRQGFLIAAGVLSALTCLAFIGLNLLGKNFLERFEVVILGFLFILWLCIAAVASSPRTGLGESCNVGFFFSWIGFFITSLMLYYILHHRGITLPFLSKSGKKKGGADTDTGRGSTATDDYEVVDDPDRAERGGAYSTTTSAPTGVEGTEGYRVTGDVAPLGTTTSRTTTTAVTPQV